MWIFKILFLAFTFAISFGGTIRFGGITPRQAITLIMIIVCSINFNTIKPYLKYILPLYLGYLFIASISAYFDGFLSDFARTLISQHLVAMVCCTSMLIYYKKAGNFDLVVKGFLLCGILNAIVCLLQYAGNPLGMAIGYLFIGGDDYQANRHMEQLIEGVGSGYLLGMRSDAVHNGYFMMIMPFLLIHYYKNLNLRHFKLIKTVLLVALFFLLAVVILLIQERSCILIFVFVFLLYLWCVFKLGNQLKKLQYIFTFLFFGGLLLYFALPPFMEYLSESRFITSDQGIRNKILSGWLEFIPSNLLLGGWKTFLIKYDYSPHNIFLNACVEAGIIGMVLTIALYFKQIKIALSIPRNNSNILICYAFLAYTLNSQLHNDSILTGDAIVWMLWGMVLAIYMNQKLESNEYAE